MFLVEYIRRNRTVRGMSCEVSIIIPNWNGKAFLKRCVAAAISSAQHSGLAYEVIVMDDCSADGSDQEVERDFPSVRVHRNITNLGFGENVNRGAALAEGKYLVLLNNDLIAKDQMIKRLCTQLSQHDVFGVGAKTVTWDSHEPNHLNMRGRFHQGRFRLTYSDESCPTDTMFVQGGSCAVKRDIFISLGGFSPLFAPGYWEDYDISYQALKAGYRNIYDPLAVGQHLGQGSMIRAHGQEKIDRIRYRNEILFSLLNFSDPELLKCVINHLPANIAHSKHPRMLSRIAASADILRMSRSIRIDRNRRAGAEKIRDEVLLDRFAGFGTLC